MGSHPRGTLPAECVLWSGAGWRARLPPRPSRGRRHPHSGRTVLKWDFVVKFSIKISVNWAFIFSDPSHIFSLSLPPCRTELGGNTKCWERRCTCQLLSPSQQTGKVNATRLHKRNVNIRCFYLMYICVCLFTRSKWELSLKPAPGRRRLQHRLGIKWSSLRPTWSSEVV